MASLLDIRLKKANKIYNEGEVLAGVIVIQTKTEFQHQGITLTADGSVNLQLSSKSVGLFEAFYNSIKPIQLLSVSLNAAKPGKIPAGKTEIPFEVPLKAKLNRTLYETYHGVFVNVQYTLKAEVKRSLLAKDLAKTIEFIIEYKAQKDKAELKPVPFHITPESLQNVKDRTALPNFSIKGRQNILGSAPNEYSCSRHIAVLSTTYLIERRREGKEKEQMEKTLKISHSTMAARGEQEAVETLSQANGEA
ncbi:vacuolar protein sorting-associated protein 26C-like [Diadema antillarum]|uniref:vacuolar protein sorting-associated protein 26C-like n=1 Tax=Diadema antillarum TaxID=105358 RepID=UPI003A89C268